MVAPTDDFWTETFEPSDEEILAEEKWTQEEAEMSQMFREINAGY